MCCLPIAKSRNYRPLGNQNKSDCETVHYGGNWCTESRIVALGTSWLSRWLFKLLNKIDLPIPVY
jgi:hypothetical protein